MILRKTSCDPGPAAIKDPHNLHMQGIFREERSGSFSSKTTTVLPACLPIRGTHDRRKERGKRHDRNGTGCLVAKLCMCTL
ncbi:unnamed protein product [Sphagnum troendelagicum]|uniref:Uncharacterized protein n=1 Tax=Sphagnum troendelagicum TaxID=128251 RepID=A0ABP0TJK2_9BRYO